MKEQGIFFTEQQKDLLQEIDRLENNKEYLDERKSLNTMQRMVIANKIFNDYSMLKNNDGIFHAQLFSAMEVYLKECTKIDYHLRGL